MKPLDLDSIRSGNVYQRMRYEGTEDFDALFEEVERLRAGLDEALHMVVVAGRHDCDIWEEDPGYIRLRALLPPDVQAAPAENCVTLVRHFSPVGTTLTFNAPHRLRLANGATLTFPAGTEIRGPFEIQCVEYGVEARDIFEPVEET